MRQPFTTAMETRQKKSAFQVLQRAQESNPAPRCILPDSTGDFFREHGPSLGKTPHRKGELERVILTRSRIPQREGTFG
jgi:hypothetical protein